MKSHTPVKGSKVKWIALCFIVFILVIVLLADLGIIPGFLAGLYNFPNGDKVGHFLLMGILALLVVLSVVVNSAQKPVRRLLITAIIIMAVVGLEEASQALFGSRHADLVDMASSWAGIITATSLVTIILLRRSRKID